MEITKVQLEELADPRSWERGVDYYKQGNVLSVLEDKNIVVAKVGGRHNYNVRLWLEEGELNSSCSCPMTMKAALSGKGGVNTEAIRRTIREATNTRGFVDYGSAYDFSKRIDGVVDCIEEVLAEGYADEVIGLAEYALQRVEEALGEADDSDGDMGTILGRLGEIHHKACVQAKPDPQALANRLFEWELATGWDTFHRAAENYADVLGDSGLAVYHSLAEAREDKHPADSISVYKARIDPLVARTNNGAYQEALGLLRRIRRLCKALEQEEEFQRYVSSLCEEYKRKRNFIKMLAALR